MNEVLAKVGNKSLTREDLRDFQASMPPEYAQQLASLGEEVIVEELINQELLYQDALANKIQDSEAYKAEMDKLSKEVLKGMAINEVLMKAEPSQDESESFYNENKESFVRPEQVAASHILVENLEEATAIKKQLDEGGNFSQLALEKSTCPSKENGGALGLFEKGKMVPEFEEVAFKMQVGETSQPVKTQFGYHIIQVDNKTSEGRKTFEEALPEIVEQLRSQKQQEAYAGYMEELRKKFPVTK